MNLRQFDCETSTLIFYVTRTNAINDDDNDDDDDDGDKNVIKVGGRFPIFST